VDAILELADGRSPSIANVGRNDHAPVGHVRHPLELTRGWALPSAEARPDVDVLIVAGDLTPRAERGVRWLLDRVADRPVIYVMGNHEGYGCDLGWTLEKAKAAADGTNVRVLENETAQVGNVTFCGRRGVDDFALNGDPQSAMAVASDRMNDSKKIRIANYKRPFLPIMPSQGISNPWHFWRCASPSTGSWSSFRITLRSRT